MVCQLKMTSVQYLPLLIVDTGEIPMNDGVVWTETKRPQIGSHRPVEDPCLFENIPEVDVGIQESGVQLYSLHITERIKTNDPRIFSRRNMWHCYLRLP